MSTTTFAGVVFLFTATATLGALRFTGGGRPDVEPGQEDPLGFQDPRQVHRDWSFSPGERRNVQIFERVAPSVVHVDAVGVALHRQRADQMPPDGVGSGFVWSDRGHIVTSLHVVRDRSGATSVTLADGSKWPAEFVGMDEQNDLAVLSIPAPVDQLHPIQVGSSAELIIGQDVLAIGNPFGLDHTLTAGVVSGLDRSISGDATSVIDGTIQHDAAIYPGSSGGPLLDSAGHLIGLNTAVRAGSSRLAFAIPVDVVNESVPRMIATGFDCWPELGLVLAPEEKALELLQVSGWMEQTGLEFGVIIVEVHQGGVAEEAGVLSVETGVNIQRIGDVIVGVDGRELSSREELTRHLARCKPGQEVRLDLRRRGEPEEVVLIFQAR